MNCTHEFFSKPPKSDQPDVPCAFEPQADPIAQRRWHARCDAHTPVRSDYTSRNFALRRVGADGRPLSQTERYCRAFDSLCGTVMG